MLIQIRIMGDFPEFAWSTQINRTKIAENFKIYLKIH